jgi:hypothetical protein
MTFKCEYQVPEVIHGYNVINTASCSLTWRHQQWKEGFIITMGVSCNGVVEWTISVTETKVLHPTYPWNSRPNLLIASVKYLPNLSQQFAFLNELDARVLESVDEAADNARLPFRRQSVKIEQTPLNDSTEKNEMLGNGGNTRPRCEEIERIDLVQKG